MIDEYQTQINNIDRQMIDLLSLRDQLVTLVATNKLELNLPTLDVMQQKSNQSNLISYGQSKRLNTKLIRRLWRFLDHESTKNQSKILLDIDRKIKLEVELQKIKLRSRKSKSNKNTK